MSNVPTLRMVEEDSPLSEHQTGGLELEVLKGALDYASANIMIADPDYNIVYMNSAMHTTMKAAEADLQESLPNFRADRLVGENIDVFHKDPSHQRRLLDGLNKTYHGSIVLPLRRFKFIANPIYSPAGARIGTVVEWDDITQEHAMESEMGHILKGAKEGDISRRIELSNKEGFLLEQSSAINDLLTLMADVLQTVTENARTVERTAAEISSGNDSLSDRTQSQAAELEETSASVEEITSATKLTADNAVEASRLAVDARHCAEEGERVVENAIASMGKINASSNEIANIIGIIDEIAFQTNLLALNAAVEAARAGEQGRGFAVVAEEVRNLAQRSGGAAKEIKGLINDSVIKVGDGTKLVEETGETLSRIMASICKVGDIIEEIAGSSGEQATGIQQVNRAILSLDETTQQNTALVEENAAASAVMRECASKLVELIQSFNIGAPQ